MPPRSSALSSRPISRSRRGQVGHGRAVEPDAPDFAATKGHQKFTKQMPSTSFRTSTASSTTARQGRVEDGRRDQEDPRSQIKVTATCVRVPVFVGHRSVNIEMENELSAEDGSVSCAKLPASCSTTSARMAVHHPVECVGDFATFVSRSPRRSNVENGLNLGAVSDNLRKGAALTRCRSRTARPSHLKKG